MAATRHLLAAFGSETARAPAGLESPGVTQTHHAHPSADEVQEQERLTKSLLEQVTAASFKGPTRHSIMAGKGVGFSWESSPFCSYAAKHGVHILIAGEVSEWPGGISAVDTAHDAFVRNEPNPEPNDAHWLLDFYSTFSNLSTDAIDDDEILEKALSCLAGIKGDFAFVIYDDKSHRVLAARDAQGSQPLFWGVTPQGQLLFGSSQDDLGACNPSATPFPPGSLFASRHHVVAYNPGPSGWLIDGEGELPGQMLSFILADADHWRKVKAIPRITSQGAVNGHVYKVSSQADMEHPIIHS